MRARSAPRHTGSALQWHTQFGEINAEPFSKAAFTSLREEHQLIAKHHTCKQAANCCTHDWRHPWGCGGDACSMQETSTGKT